MNEIIEKWCTIAHIEKKIDHKKWFWIARDILEDKIPISKSKRVQCVEFIQNNCKDSEDKQKILAHLQDKTGYRAQNSLFD